MRKLVRKKLRPSAKAGSKAKAKIATKVKVKTGVRSRMNAMRDDQLDEMTVAELKELGTRVDKAIASRMSSERNELREKLRAMVEEAGFTLADVVGNGRGKNRPAGAKFANPANPSETWSGRGRQPKWLSSRLKSGQSIEDFRV